MRLPLTVLVLAIAGASHAQSIRVSDAWIRPPPPGAPTAAGYATLTNLGKEPDTLVGASSLASARVEVHEMSMAGGVMRMRPVTDLRIPPGKAVRLEPGGLHLMLIEPKRPLKVGDTEAVTLRFAKAGPVRAMFTVQPAPVH